MLKVNHPNIVGYKNAWLEPFVGEYSSSSDENQSYTSPSCYKSSSTSSSDQGPSSKPTVYIPESKLESSLSIRFCESDTGSRSFNANYTVSFKSAECSEEERGMGSWTGQERETVSLDDLEEQSCWENSEICDNFENTRNSFKIEDSLDKSNNSVEGNG